MRVTLALVLGLSLLSLEASAQPSTQQGQGNQNSAPKPPTPDEEAQKLFEQAEANYDIQEYAAALELYKKSYLLSMRAGMLFNIGQCQRNLKMYEEAINSYKSYLSKSPNSPIKDRVEALIKQSEALLAQSKEPSSQPSTQPSQTQPIVKQPPTQPIKPPSSAPSTQPAALTPESPKTAMILYGTAGISGVLCLGTGALYLSSRSKAKASLEQNDITQSEESEFFIQRTRTFGALSNTLVVMSVASTVVAVLLAKKHKEPITQVTTSQP